MATTERILDGETVKDSRLYKLLVELVKSDQLDNLEAVAVARAVELAQAFRQDPDIQLRIGSFWITQLDRLTSVSPS